MKKEIIIEWIRNDLKDYGDDSSATDSPTFKMIRDTMAINAAELLIEPNDYQDGYYFSDSVYDELMNPSMIIHDCSNWIVAFYGDDSIQDMINSDDMMDNLIDAFDYSFGHDLLDFQDEGDSELSFDSIEALQKAIHDFRIKAMKETTK